MGVNEKMMTDITIIKSRSENSAEWEREEAERWGVTWTGNLEDDETEAAKEEHDSEISVISGSEESLDEEFTTALSVLESWLLGEIHTLYEKKKRNTDFKRLSDGEGKIQQNPVLQWRVFSVLISRIKHLTPFPWIKW